MARFIAYAQGNRGPTSRCGTHITTRTNGWNCGVNVRGFKNEQGLDELYVSATGGSNDRGGETGLIAVVTTDPNGLVKVQHKVALAVVDPRTRQYLITGFVLPGEKL